LKTSEIRKKLRVSLESLKAREAEKEIQKLFESELTEEVGPQCYLSERELASIDLDKLQKFLDKVLEIRLKYDEQYASTEALLGDENE